jgi:cell division protein FtsW
MSSRADRAFLTQWFWTVDRVALGAVLSLIAIGLMLAFAASPAVTGGESSEGNFMFAGKQILFAVVAAGIMIGVSILPLRTIKLGGAVLFALATICTALVMFLGQEALGAKRWIDFGFMTFQPSEFLKPSFALFGAAILADRQEIRLGGVTLPKPLVTFALLAPALFFLIKEPDVGQTALLLALWGALLFFAGLPLAGIGILAGASTVLAWLAYFLVPHVHHRIDQYLTPDAKEKGYQTGLALKAFAHGGLTGVGPGAGTVKYLIPQVNSDFIFAVAGEEFGLALCGLIALLFMLLTVRVLLRSAQARDPFAQLAGAALGTVLALQAFINMGVAVSLLPAKGMTLPFISYGGSSLFAVALTTGLALAVTRQRSQIGQRDISLIAMLGARA